MLQFRQATWTSLKRIGPSVVHRLHHIKPHRIVTRAAEQYGPQRTVTRTESAESATPAASATGSESDSDSDAGFPLLDAEAKHDDSDKALGPLAGLGSIGGIVLLLAGGVLMKDVIKDFLVFFMDAVEQWGPLGYLAYALVYTGLEVLAVPAIPLTMTAGIIFGPIPGTILVSLAGTLAATIAFLIARYAARERVLRWARRNNKFAAIDRAIAKNGFKFVTLLRLSPLFPLAVSNYLYGLTSVDLWSYIAGSWIGMLPGTYAYVSAGHLGKAALMDGEGSLGVESWQVGLGLGVTLLAIAYVGKLAKTAIEEAEAGSDVDTDADEAGPSKAAATAAAAAPAPGHTSLEHTLTNGHGSSHSGHGAGSNAVVGNGLGLRNGDGNGHSAEVVHHASSTSTSSGSSSSSAGGNAKSR